MPEYNVWRSMKRRCTDPRNEHYSDYGGRGITVCQRWMESMQAFYEDMGPRPSPAHSIDRYPDPDGNYEPSNCRWATSTEQNRNRGGFNARVEWRGETRTIAGWVDVTGLPRDSVYWRLAHGWSPERAFTEPVRHGRRPSEYGKFANVAFHKKTQKYFAYQGRGKDRHYVGSYDSAEEAALHTVLR